MQLLIDTHIWVWATQTPKKLRRPVLRQVENPRNELWVSPISLWEAVLQKRGGRLKGIPDLQKWLEQSRKFLQLREAPLTLSVVQEAATFRLNHNDPADHLLVATARHYGLTLVTSDEQIIAANAVEILANR